MTTPLAIIRALASANVLATREMLDQFPIVFVVVVVGGGMVIVIIRLCFFFSLSRAFRIERK